MTESLKICFVAAEAVPFAKTGGLGDVAGALPRHLFRLGHDVRPFIPFHGTIDRQAHELTRVDFIQNVALPIGSRTAPFSLWSSQARNDEPPFYLVDCPEMFQRSAVYTADDDEYRRFAFFSRAVIESCQRMGWGPDVFHCNDWHTALIPLLLKSVYDWDALFRTSASAMTIHNIGYQGRFPIGVLDDLGLSGWAHLFDQDDTHAGYVNFLRSGVIYADIVTTVSPTYAKEIQTEPYGHGLDGLLRARSDRLIGILNGVDYEAWNPETDPLIPHSYSGTDPAGKRKNKVALLNKAGLNGRRRAPLVGIVSRLTAQKGFDLCFPVLPEVLATTDLRLVVLGTGESKYEEFFDFLRDRFPSQVAYYRGYSDELAHLIEAGSDMFLMPSRYEPCGLNQMFSLKYGTIPIVRRTGGLADSVELYNAETGEGTGFVFDHFHPSGLRWSLDYAMTTYRDASAWKRLMSNAMQRDYSWEIQSKRYAETFSSLLRSR